MPVLGPITSSVDPLIRYTLLEPLAVTATISPFGEEFIPCTNIAPLYNGVKDMEINGLLLLNEKGLRLSKPVRSIVFSTELFFGSITDIVLESSFATNTLSCFCIEF